MKRLLSTLAITVVVLGISVLGTSQEAKADSKTLHGVADIISATGYLLNGGYSETTVIYDPTPVYYEPVYYAPVRYHRSYYHYNPRPYRHYGGYHRRGHHRRHH